MKRFFRLVRYDAPYWFQSLAGVLLLAVVGILDPVRVLILGPILSTVLDPSAKADKIPLFPNLPPRFQFDLLTIVPSHFHNAWTVVAFALITSTVLKGICD